MCPVLNTCVRNIVLFCCLLLSQWIGAGLVVNGVPDPNWLGGGSLTRTTEGNDFWFTYMAHNAVEPTDPSMNLTIIAVAEKEATIHVKVDTYEGTITIPAGGGEGKLSGIPTSNAYMSYQDCEQPLPRGIHVYSDDPKVPFSCYAFTEAGNGQNTTRDASMVLPTHLLGKNYFVQTYQTDTRATEFAVVITEDNTDLTIIPKVQTSLRRPAGTTIQETGLRKGTVYMVRSLHPSEAAEGESIDLSGSSICATKPVAVFQGNEAVKIATGSVGSYSVNHAFEQTLPVSQWGTTFYLGLTEHAKSNFYNIIAAYDNTKVQINTGAQVTLNAGETFSTARNLSKVIPSAKVTADKPVLVSNYLSCGGANSEDYYDTEGTLIQYNWGNSTSAMIPAWESRVKEMSFFADTISNETDDGIGHMYVQVITKTADRAKLTLDGETVPQDSFSTFTADVSMSVANIELTEEGKHTLQTTGDGFVGFVYAMTSEARAYQYTLGFNAKDFHDSLYIENDDPVMSKDSYNLDRVPGKGWYQRQEREWIKARLDTAEVCDSTTLKWRIESPADTLFRVDSIHWIISALGGVVERKDTIIQNNDLIHRWEYQFIIPQEIKDARITSVDYHVQALLYQKPLFCEAKVPIDTLQGMVRVLTVFNDTVWKAVCIGDTVTFFDDNTRFIASKSTGTPPAGAKYIDVGKSSETRRYQSIGGCDSLSTIMIYVCEPTFERRDTVVCQEGSAGLDYGDFFKKYKRNNSWPVGVDTILYDTLRTKGCMTDPEWDLFAPHCSSFKGCDSVMELKLLVKELFQHTQIVPWCLSSGLVYTWKDQESGQTIRQFSSDTMQTNVLYTFMDTIRYSSCTGCPDGGCDSVINELRLTFFSDEGQKHTIHVCQGDKYRYENMGSTYIFDSNGQLCNTAYEKPLTIYVRDEGGVEQCTFTDLLTFYIDTVYKDQMTYDTLCWDIQAVELSYSWANHPKFSDITITGPGKYEYIDTLKQFDCDCDSITKLELLVMPTYFLQYSQTISSEDTIHWENRIYAGNSAVFENPESWPVIRCAGVQVITDPLMTQAIGTHSCDSVRELTLRVGQVFRDTMYDATCANCAPYEWVITSPITGLPTTIEIDNLPKPYEERFYYDSLLTDLGFDSIFVLRLTGYPNYDFSENDEVCQGEVYSWPGHNPTDNSVAHRLYIDGQPVTVIPTSEYGVINVTDSMQIDTVYTNPQTGVVKQMLCDSVHVLTLTIHPTYNDRNTELTDHVSMSSNDTLPYFVQPRTLFVGYDFDYDAAGVTKEDLESRYDSVIYLSMTGKETWRDSVLHNTVFGCDSVHYVDIHICQVQYTVLTDSIGDNDSTWVFGGDATPDASGYRVHTLPTVYGQDFNKDADGNPINYSSLDRVVRDTLLIDTLHTEQGCDSIVQMQLRIFPSYLFHEEDTICGNDGKYVWHGKSNLNKLINDNETGAVLIYDSLTTELSGHLVDSVYILKLTILPGELSYTTRAICYNETVSWHGLPLQYDPEEPASEIVHVFQDEDSECGREIHMMPVWNPAYGYAGDPDYSEWTETIHICQYDDFHWLDANGKEHTENLRDPEGNRYTRVPTDHVGDFIIYDSLKTVGCKCDSIFTLRFHVDTTYRYVTEEYLCTGESYDWFVNGELYKTYSLHTVGDLFDTIKNETTAGCDSSYYLHLHVDSTYHIYIDETLCPTEISSYSWEGVSYDSELADAHYWDAPKEYYDTLSTTTVVAGCDSIRYLHLTILPAKDSIWSDTICESESYLLFDSVLTTSGTYVKARPNQWGCTINYRFTLLVIKPTTYTIATEPLCIDPATTNSFPLYYSYDDSFAPISYSIYYDSLAKDAGFEDLLGLPIPENGAQTDSNNYILDIEVPYFEPLEYPTPGRYTATIGFENGICEGDTLMRFPFTFTIDYPSWIMEQRHSDLIALLNEDYNGGYTWTAFQWYEGDSMLVGQTKPYLYIPTGLKVGAEYYVELTRDGEQESFPACPLVAVSKQQGTSDPKPNMPYLAVTPTCVVIAHPYIDILAQKEGTYRVTNTAGRTISEGAFHPDVTTVQLPAIEGLYIVQLWSINTTEEPYRAIKVMVKQECPNCETSSF